MTEAFFPGRMATGVGDSTQCHRDPEVLWKSKHKADIPPVLPTSCSWSHFPEPKGNQGICESSGPPRLVAKSSGAGIQQSSALPGSSSVLPLRFVSQAFSSFLGLFPSNFWSPLLASWFSCFCCIAQLFPWVLCIYLFYCSFLGVTTATPPRPSRFLFNLHPVEISSLLFPPPFRLESCPNPRSPWRHGSFITPRSQSRSPHCSRYEKRPA